jgi:hypothetical protein
MFFSYQKKNKDQVQQHPEDAGEDIDKKSAPRLKSDYGSTENELGNVEDEYAETSFHDPREVSEESKNALFFRTTKKTKGAMFFLLSFLLLTAGAMVAAIGCGRWFPFENENSISGTAPSLLQSKDLTTAASSEFGQPAEFSAAMVQDAMQPANSARKCVDDTDGPSPGPNWLQITKLGLSITGLGLISDLLDLVGELKNTSDYYSCNADEKLENQKERILLEFRQILDLRDFDIAYAEASTFMERLSNHEGDSTLDKLSWEELNSLSFVGMVSTMTAAENAGILGAEIYSKVAILVNSILSIQLGKAHNRCDVTVNHLMDNIDDAVDHIRKLIHDSASSISGQYTCRAKNKYKLITVPSKYGPIYKCVGGEYICEPNADGTIDFNVYLHHKGADKKAIWSTNYPPYWYCPNGDTYMAPLKLEAEGEFEAQFNNKRNAWLNGDSNEADDEGIRFFHDELKEIQKNLRNDKDLKRKCGKLLVRSWGDPFRIVFIYFLVLLPFFISTM